MDNIEKLLIELKNDQSIKRMRFSGRFANTVGEIYEKYGYGATKAFLSDRLSNEKENFEARTLLYVLNKINNAHLPLSLGGFIIRKIDMLQR